MAGGGTERSHGWKIPHVWGGARDMGGGGLEVGETWGAHIRRKLSFLECSLLCGDSVGGG